MNVEPDWNFAKYLLDGDSNCVKFYGDIVEPNACVREIEALLA